MKTKSKPKQNQNSIIENLTAFAILGLAGAMWQNFVSAVHSGNLTMELIISTIVFGILAIIGIYVGKRENSDWLVKLGTTNPKLKKIMIILKNHGAVAGMVILFGIISLSPSSGENNQTPSTNQSYPLVDSNHVDGTIFIPSGNLAKSGLPMFDIKGNHVTLEQFNIVNATKVFSVQGNNTSISNIHGYNVKQMLETGNKSNNTKIENVTVTNPSP